MMNSKIGVEALSPSDLLSRTRELVRTSHGTEADLLVHLAEIEERKLYLDWSFSSMFTFCVRELNFSEDVACNRINVARAVRRMPAILEALRSGCVHLAGLRLLAPHLTADNCEKVLAEAANKSKREIEELVVRLAPQPPVPSVVRKIPERRDDAPHTPTPSGGPSGSVTVPSPSSVFVPSPVPPRDGDRPVVKPLSEETFKFQFTASRACRDNLRRAQDLLRHRIPDGDVGTIVEKALAVLVADLEKERFAEGRKDRQKPTTNDDGPQSRYVPAAIRREVYKRDGGRCTFTDDSGRRCAETSALEFDHCDGFARTHMHRADRIRLLCRAHNQHAAEKMYGRAFMERARASANSSTGAGVTAPSG